jgi:predicted ATPase/DNA-binding winged helix-turn-helix (wHTH) protein
VPNPAIGFGPFRLFAKQHLLLEGDKPLRLGSRALDILIVLVERAGELITKEELVARVWPNTTVEEGNLRVHIAAIRKALGDGLADNHYVATIPGRGYRFVAPISFLETSTVRPPAALESAHNLPAFLTQLIGRAEIVGTLVGQLQERRLITVVGPGGVGKTAVALAVAHELSASFHDGVQFVDLASVPDPLAVPSALAGVFGPDRLRPSRDKELLLVLDSCEHVIELAAALSEEILNRAPGVHILATSRERLRASGEWVHRLLPLGVPSLSNLSAAEALAFPAIQLFVERATANSDEFKLTDIVAPSVADICRQLDGMPLAIELAAGRVDSFGIAGIASRLDNRFHLLRHGHRTALARHQTLGATLDWSYDLLPASERVVLRRLAVFAGWFTMAAASAVASGGQLAETDVVDSLANLAEKSLVATDVGGATVHYRLLESTRAYSLDKLKESGEAKLLAERHAEYFRVFFGRAQGDWEMRAPAQSLSVYARPIDNVRTTSNPELLVPIKAHGDVVLARQTVCGLASRLRFSGSEMTLIATAISEVARNIVTYAGSGEIVLRVVQRGHRCGIVVIARDRGPGIADIERTMADGYSTSRGLGLGLPGCKRLMDEFEIVSRVGKGTEITMTKWER